MPAVTPRAGSHDVTLRMENLTKEFRGFTAVRNLSLDVHRGTIHALIGPNGAGKTTVFNLATKFLSPDQRSRVLQGHRHHPDAAGRGGAARHGAFVPDLRGVRQPDGARERAHRVAAVPQRRLLLLAFGACARRAERARRARCSNEVGLEVFAERKAIELSYGRRRALEIATTLALDPELLLLDEPMSGLGQEDIGRIARLIRKQRGRPHRADGRAQPVRRRRSVGPHHRAGARRGPGRWPLCRGLARSGGGRGLSGVRP